MKARILWIAGKRAESPHFVPGLRKKGYIIETFATGSEALANLTVFDPDLIVIDAASLHSSGKRISRALKAKAQSVPILLIIDDQQSNLSDPSTDVLLILPFTARKLLNRIRPLLPGDSGNLLHQGPIRLDFDRKRLYCQGRETSLTPRVAQLMKIFMEHPGEVLEREALFRKIWNTEYTEDTRTLDVHISWLRHALEENPHKPRYLKTIRGVGYRLDVQTS